MRQSSSSGWRLMAVRGSARGSRFRGLPPLRPLASLVAHTGLGRDRTADISWEELSARLAAHTMTLATGAPIDQAASTEECRGAGLTSGAGHR
jgi:hypothetical protein